MLNKRVTHMEVVENGNPSANRENVMSGHTFVSALNRKGTLACVKNVDICKCIRSTPHDGLLMIVLCWPGRTLDVQMDNLMFG